MKSKTKEQEETIKKILNPYNSERNFLTSVVDNNKPSIIKLIIYLIGFIIFIVGIFGENWFKLIGGCLIIILSLFIE